ncbi:hypothetical protein IAT40_003270 [Kwoniella sp. CBS 6097]
MPRKGGPPRSLFHSLPFDLKSSLRSQPQAQTHTKPSWFDPVQSGAEQFRLKAEAIEASSVDGLLSTQPALTGDADEDDESESDGAEEDPISTRPAQKRSKVQRTLPYHQEGSIDLHEFGGRGRVDNQAGYQQDTSNAEAGPSHSTLSSAPPLYSRPTFQSTSIVKSIRYESPFIPPFIDPAKSESTTPSRVAHSKRKKGKRPVVKPVNHYSGHAWDCTGLVERYTDYTEVPSDLVKYFAQRRLYFPEYDTLPLLLDRTGWFSVTPQPIAEHIAQRSACDVVLDAFCGVGGNIIEFAKTCERVIAIDNDLTRLKLARHNALHRGVADRIEFILGDYTDFARSYAHATKASSIKGKEKAQRDIVDVVFLSPPWGGINYLEGAEQFPLSAILPIPGDELFDLTTHFTPNIAYYLPKNTDLKELSKLAKEIVPDKRKTKNGDGTVGRQREWVEVEEEWVGDKLKAITAYFGGLVADE